MRKAVAAVIVIAISAVMNCQYVCQTVSKDALLELVRTPATRVIVHMMVRTVRQRVDAKTSFCDHRTLNLQMRWNGINNTAEKFSYATCKPWKTHSKDHL